jgi:hypothetical protein
MPDSKCSLRRGQSGLSVPFFNKLLEIFFCDIDKLSSRRPKRREDLLPNKGCGSFGHLASPDAQLNSALGHPWRSCDAQAGTGPWAGSTLNLQIAHDTGVIRPFEDLREDFVRSDLVVRGKWICVRQARLSSSSVNQTRRPSAPRFRPGLALQSVRFGSYRARCGSR